MKKAVLFLLLLAAYNLPAQSIIPKDTQFVAKAFRCGMLEIKLGELTITKAKSDSVRVLGRQMIVDHTKANDQLKTLAVSKNIPLSDSLGQEGQRHYNELSQMSGDDFDKAFVQLMIKEHEKAIVFYKDEDLNGSDNDVRSWASVTLPVLKHHLMTAQDANVDLSKKNKPQKEPPPTNRFGH